ncbi:hypothetical protein PGB90_006179 [Kerria lacca]
MPQKLDVSRFSQNCVARALYDNVAESPDELPFRKGDLLTVLEQNTAGLEGWWLCSLRGRQGICPGNRLRLLAGVYDSGQKLNDELSSPQYHGKRRSWHTQSNKVVTPQKIGDVYLYDLPANRGMDCRYDVPPSGQPIPAFDNTHNAPYRILCGLYGDSRPESSGSSSGYGVSGDVADNFEQSRYDIPKWPPIRISTNAESYDVPRPINPIGTLSPSSSVSSFSITDSTGSNRSSIAPDCEMPKSRPLSFLHLQLQKLQENEIMSYDILPSAPHPRELPLELNSAIENLEKLESEVTSAIGKLLSYAGPSWREREKLQPVLMDIKLAVLRLRSSLHDLSEFSEGVLGNALNAPDKGLAQRLRPLVKVLYETNNTVQESVKMLDDCEWSIDVLCKTPNYCSTNDNYLLDSLDQLIDCARCLTEDIREFASFVQGNATLLFKRNIEDECSKAKSNDDSDYVNLDTHKTLKKQHSEVRSLLSQDMQKSFDLLIKESENGDTLSADKYSNGLDSNDKQVLSFYATQCATHSLHLTHAIDAFLNTVEHNQPPKVFLAHGKFVILSAHRLVHIGDTVHQNVSCPETSAKILQLSNALSEGLATTVHKIKGAAMQFPSVNAVQEMVDAVVDVSHLARDLKMCIIVNSQTYSNRM